MFMLDNTSGKPIYEQLQEQIIKLALSGVYEIDEQLPSVRVLAKELMVNPNTVQKAYQMLEKDGVIYSVPGKGNFISENAFGNDAIKERAILGLENSVKECFAYKIPKEKVIRKVNDVYNDGESE